MKQQETRNKEQTISRLYALRAGLSVMSQENDKVQQLYGDAEYSAYSEAVKVTSSVVYNSKYGLSTNKIEKKDVTDCKELKPEIDKILQDDSYEEQCREDVKRTDQYLNNAKQKRKKSLALFFIFLFIFVAAVAVGVLYRLTGINVVPNAEGEQKEAIVYGGSIISGIIALICAFIYGRRFRRAGKNISTLEQDLVEYKNVLSLAQEAPDKIKRIRRNAKQTIDPIQQNAEQFYYGLREEFGNLLDERDWGNVDLIIYCLETGRADSMKEALLWVDKELQTQRIVDTIRQASAQICSTIGRAFAALQSTVTQCFSSLSAQLSVQNAQLARLTQSVNLNNALQEKANVASAQLASDVRQIREFIYSA